MAVAQLYSQFYNKPPLDEYLAHHGILGQKWGKRNGPPYPLGASDHSASEKKAGWRKSLDKGEKKSDNKSKPKSSDSGKSPADKQKPISKSSEHKKGLTDEQKRFARNVVIGAAITAAVLSTAYVGYKYKSSQAGDKILKAFDKSLDLRGKELGAKLSEVPIDALSDDDVIIRRGTETFQRIVVGTSKANALMQEKTSDIMYATYSEKDNNFYKSVFARIIQKKGTGQQFVSTMTNINDLRIPSEKKRVSAFVDLVKNDSDFKATLESELSKRYPGRRITLDANNAQSFYSEFATMFGNKDSASRKAYIKKLVEMGYNALIDDNDANRLGETPIITLSATNDMAITGMKKLSNITQLLAGLKLEDFDFDNW